VIYLSGKENQVTKKKGTKGAGGAQRGLKGRVFKWRRNTRFDNIKKEPRVTAKTVRRKKGKDKHGEMAH